MAEKSPFFRPGAPRKSSQRLVVVQTTTPIRKGKRYPREESDDGVIPEQKSSMVGTSANLVNAIVGCGIVGIPYAVRQCGFVAGVLLIFGVAICTEKSLRLLIFTAKHIHVPSYETLAEACFGSFGFQFVAINMLFCSYGAMVTYLMVVKECFAALLLRDDPELNTPLLRRTVLVVVSLVVMFPLACRRDMADLAQTSRVNVAIDVALVGIVAWNAWYACMARDATSSYEYDAALDSPTANPSIWVHWDTLFVGLGVLSFAFVCQHSAYIIAGSLHRPTVRRWSSVTSGALSFCCILALFCGISGFLGFREETQGNILENLDPNGVTANVARAMLGTTMCLVFPLESFVARHVCVVLLFEGRAAHEGDDAHILSRRDRRVGLTAALYVLAVLPAAVFTDLGPVLALSGAIGGSCLSYIGPGAVFLGVHGERFLALVRDSWLGKEYECSTPRGVASSTSRNNIVIAVSPNESTRQNPEENTPLLSTGIDTRSQTVMLAAGTTLENVARSTLWILTAMPLWTRIAKIGMGCLKQHVHDLALKSPHPIRIGRVEYERAVVTTHQGETVGSRIQNIDVQNETTQSQSADVITYSMSSENFKKLIGPKNAMDSMDLPPQQVNEEMDEDPQKDPPSWQDFCIAIGYILLGIVALIAGIGSIYLQQRTG